MKKIAGLLLLIFGLGIGSLVIAQENKTQEINPEKAMNSESVEHCVEMKHGLMMDCLKMNNESLQKESSETKNNQTNTIQEKETLSQVIDQGNPIAADEKSIAQGKIIYSQNCSSCHGEKGQGDGPVAQYFGSRIADLSNPNLKEKSDSELFTKITDGTWPMPAHWFSLGKEDIWNAINYVRTLSGEKNSQK